MEDRIEKLELKITELENKLREMGATRTSSQIDPEDLKTYQKVSNQLGGLQKACTVCQPQICRTCIPSPCISCLCPCGPGFCQPCVCTCGPCMQSSGTGDAFGGFME